VSAPEVIPGAALFTDIVGFTEFNALQGDGEALRLIGLQEQCVLDELSPGSRVIKEMGDGMLIWFPSACDAVQTAIRLQRRFELISEDPGTPLWVRMGIHWGNHAVRRDDIVGHDVNIAARVMDTAGPGEIVVSERTKRIAAPDLPEVRFVELGPVRMKGIPEPIRLFRVATDGW
jgi:class 3 adenylate cyclase